jgi:hypothetical protein
VYQRSWDGSSTNLFHDPSFMDSERVKSEINPKLIEVVGIKP